MCRKVSESVGSVGKCRKMSEVSEVIDENLRNVITSFKTGENLRTMCKEAMSENGLCLEEKMKK